MATPKVRRAMYTVNYFLMMVFGVLMSWYGVALVRGTWAGNMPGMFLPQGVDYIPLVISGVLIAIYSTEKLMQVYTLPDEE